MLKQAPSAAPFCGGRSERQEGLPRSAMHGPMPEVLAAFIGSLLAGLAAYYVAKRQRGWDRAAEQERREAEQASARRDAESLAVGQLAAAVEEMRWEAARLATMEDAERYTEARKLAPLRGRMLAAHTVIYSTSDDETLIKTSLAVVRLGFDLADVAQSPPFDPAKYETLRSMFERTFRNLRQRARSLAELPALEGEPTNETTDDLEGEGDPAAW